MREQSPDVLRRARIILSFAIVLCLLGLETAFFFYHMAQPEDTAKVLSALGIAFFMVFLIPLVFRVWGSLVVGANLILGGAYISMVTILATSGGIEAQFVHWLGLLPMLAALMGLRASTWVWLAICILTVLGFVLLDYLGIETSRDEVFAGLDGPTLWFQRSVNVGSWVGILIAVALLFESHKDKQTEQLAAQNAELESQMRKRQRAEKRSQFLAYYDELTGLPNRHFFLEQLASATELSARRGGKVALLFLDLDQFKEVNDLHGHALGDQLLRQMAERLLGCVRGTDSVSHPGPQEVGSIARLGGDEFTILLNGIHSARDAATVAERILDGLNQPFVLEDLQLYMGTSIGIAIASNGDLAAGDLLRNADLAMYQAKNAGKNNYKFHDDSMNEEILFRTATTNALRKALEEDGIELHYQPIVDGLSQEVRGVEGLMRWNRDGRGYVSTEDIVRVAEETGLIIPLGEWVIDRACRQYRAWRMAGVNLQRVSINVSGEQFRHGGLVPSLVQALEKYSIEPHCLEVEITEGAMMADEQKALQTLRAIRELGVKIALDDFGTGFSSLSYVHRFPVDTIKIDRGFIADVVRDHSSQAITISVITLAHQLGMRVVAEGVENVLQEQFLLNNGCDEMQGYLYDMPMTAEEIARALAPEFAQ
jgi:diguanylate cyclase (GGDEF)-like protein